MFTTVIIKQIEDEKNGESYMVGSRVRVLLKSRNEYIGTIDDIFPDSLSLLVDSEEKIIELDSIDKMRPALLGESFYNRFEF